MKEVKFRYQFYSLIFSINNVLSGNVFGFGVTLDEFDFFSFKNNKIDPFFIKNFEIASC